MVTDTTILACMPGLASLSSEPCCNCQNNFICLGAAWVPQRLMKIWKNQWRKEAKHIPALEVEPAFSAQVGYLKTIRPAKLSVFIKKNCDGHNDHCP
jgi:hypothetical protein